MGKVTGFLEIDRQVPKYRPASDRVRHSGEFLIPMSDDEVRKQAARCMDCGIPYCHGDTGCPVHNQIPDWNDLIYNDDWETAVQNLHSTNNFPEFTGRICPAPCEEACTLNLEDEPVAIKTVEQAIADKAYELNLIRPQSALNKTGKKIAVVGSGPAGLSFSAIAAARGHRVTLFEQSGHIGGQFNLANQIPGKQEFNETIRYFNKQIELHKVELRLNKRVTADELSQENFDEVILATGIKPRTPKIESH